MTQIQFEGSLRIRVSAAAILLFSVVTSAHLHADNPRAADAAEPKASAGKNEDSLDVARFGRLPLRFNGRVVTFDDLARHALREVSGRTFYFGEDGQKQPAIRWLLDIISDDDAAAQSKVFLVADDQLIEAAGLPRRRPRSASLQRRRNH